VAQHVLKNTGATLQESFSQGAADGAVTVTAVRADGTTASTGTATHTTGGDYTYFLPPQVELDQLTVTWAGTWAGIAQSLVSHVEIVGEFLFTIADARTFGDRVLADTSRYPDADIRAARERVTDLFDQVCHVSFVPRYGRDTLDGTNSDTIDLTHRRPRRIISGSLQGVALTSQQIADVALYPGGRAVWISGTWWSWRRNSIVLAYEHGWPAPPTDVSRAALVLARYDLVSNDISDRMIAFDNDLGTVRLSIPGRQFPTGIPIVDATLARYDECPLLLA
jgi:hypothetical protein